MDSPREIDSNLISMRRRRKTTLAAIQEEVAAGQEDSIVDGQQTSRNKDQGISSAELAEESFPDGTSDVVRAFPSTLLPRLIFQRVLKPAGASRCRICVRVHPRRFQCPLMARWTHNSSKKPPLLTATVTPRSSWTSLYSSWTQMWTDTSTVGKG